MSSKRTTSRRNYMFDQTLWALIQDNPGVLDALLHVFSGTV
ncbi:hypothetical protein [Gordonia alkaliphila]|nr:hypothetical protein [Gordonia alkaliphila]